MFNAKSAFSENPLIVKRSKMRNRELKRVDEREWLSDKEMSSGECECKRSRVDSKNNPIEKIRAGVLTAGEDSD